MNTNPLILEAGKLGHVVVLCCHVRRRGLNEAAIERGIKDLLEAEGWAVFPVIAELTGGLRRAKKGSLDLVAFDQTGWLSNPWWIEAKRGDRDLTPEQFRRIKDAPKYGVQVIICDEVDLLKEWIKK